MFNNDMPLLRTCGLAKKFMYGKCFKLKNITYLKKANNDYGNVMQTFSNILWRFLIVIDDILGR